MGLAAPANSQGVAQAGFDYETVAAWITRFGDHAEAITERLARELHLSEVEVDELWSFVGQKGARKRQQSKPILPQEKTRANAGLHERRPRGTLWVPLRRGLGERAARGDLGPDGGRDDPAEDGRAGRHSRRV